MPWVGSPSIVNVTALKLAGPALYGTYGVADYAEDSSEGQGFGDAYRNAYKVAPDNQSSWTYDAVTVLAAPSTRPARPTRQAIRRGDPVRQGHKGAEGEYNFDQNGDGLHGYNIVQNNKGNIVFAKRIDFND